MDSVKIEPELAGQPLAEAVDSFLSTAPLSHSEIQKIYRDLVASGDISSEGEFSDIARREMSSRGINVTDAQALIQGLGEDELVASGHQNKPLNPEGGADRSVSTGINPSIQDWGGTFRFDLRVPDPSKSKDAHYSKGLNKLFINMNRSVKVFFNISIPPENESVPLPPSLDVRGVVVYTNADDFKEPVKVCYTHSRDSSGKLRTPLSEHLLRCTEQETFYFQDPRSNRHSVVSRLPPLQPGSDEVCMAYKFSDLGSCSGGLNRRDVAVIFTLEHCGSVLGRKALPVRICTCPRRDMEVEEGHLRARQPHLGGANTAAHPSGSANTAAHPSGSRVVLGSIPIINTSPQRGSRGAAKRTAGSDPARPKRAKNASTASNPVSEVENGANFWVLARSELNFRILRNLGEALELKDGGDTTLWNRAVSSMNEKHLGDK